MEQIEEADTVTLHLLSVQATQTASHLLVEGARSFKKFQFNAFSLKCVVVSSGL